LQNYSTFVYFWFIVGIYNGVENKDIVSLERYDWKTSKIRIFIKATGRDGK
jgi:hypothetical protein